MPRIKSPINAAEQLYNLRYNNDTQRIWIKRIEFKPLDSYAKGFLQNVIPRILDNRELTEPQADYLAELYDRYSE